MKQEVEDLLKKFEKDNNCTIVYITEFGSTLYGTNNPESDVDYKGIFVPNERDVLLKRDVDNFVFSTNPGDSKNGTDDIDVSLHSVHKFMNLVQKGETGAIDLLFSMFREETVVYEDFDFTYELRENYSKLLSSNVKSFIGYAIGQSKRYNIRGSRYNELVRFLKENEVSLRLRYDQKLNESIFSSIVESLDDYKYILKVRAPGPRKTKEIDYIEVLGKKFGEHVTCGYLLDKLTHMEQQYGNRARASTENIDWKSMGHCVRIISEVQELLEDGYVTFPLKNLDYVKSVRYGERDLEEVVQWVDTEIDRVNEMVLETYLPQKGDTEYIDGFLLTTLSSYGRD